MHKHLYMLPWKCNSSQPEYNLHDPVPVSYNLVQPPKSVNFGRGFSILPNKSICVGQVLEEVSRERNINDRAGWNNQVVSSSLGKTAVGRAAEGMWSIRRSPSTVSDPEIALHCYLPPTSIFSTTTKQPNWHYWISVRGRCDLLMALSIPHSVQEFNVLVVTTVAHHHWRSVESLA